MHEKTFSNLQPFDDMEVNRMYTNQFYWPFRNVHGFPDFSRDGCACTSSRH